MKKYDSIIFGNGFNCAVASELIEECESRYKYLFKLEDFLEKLYEYENGEYKDEIIELAEQVLLESCNYRFANLYQRLSKYYVEEPPIHLICNIETRLVKLIQGFLNSLTTNKEEIFWGISVEVIGKEIEELQSKNWVLFYRDISVKKKKLVENHLKRLDDLLSEIYMLYNIHAVVLNWYISKNLKLEERRKQYYQNFYNKHLKADSYVLTTNYGEEIKEYYPNVEYLHGKFIPYGEILSVDGKVTDRLKIKKTDGNYSFLFGATPVKKHYVIEKGIYDNRLFLDAEGDTSREYGKLLVFGMSFATVHKGLLYPGMTKKVFYENIDTHIMKAINDLFVRRKIHSVTIVAYNEEDNNRYKKFFESFKASKDVIIGQLYEIGKIKIISEKEFLREDRNNLSGIIDGLIKSRR